MCETVPMKPFELQELWNAPGVEITGPVKSVHQYVDMPTAETEVLNKTTGKTEKVRGCMPAMGYSAGAGTTDGPFIFFLKQGSMEHIWWLDAISHAIAKPSEEDVKCHAPKPILLATGHVRRAACYLLENVVAQPFVVSASPTL